MADANPNPNPSSRVVPQPRQLERTEAQQVAKEVCASEDTHDLHFMLSVGALLLARIYNNQLDCWHQHGDQGVPSIALVIEELHALGRLSWNKTRVLRAIRLLEQDVVLGGLKQFTQLAPSHFAVVQGLDFDSQRELLRAADAGSMPVAVLEALARAKRSPHPTTPPTPVNADLTDAYRSAERVRLAIGRHDEWLADAHEAGLLPEQVQAFDAEFERFLGALEDFMAYLGRMGALIPERRKKMLEERMAQVEHAAQKSRKS